MMRQRLGSLPIRLVLGLALLAGISCCDLLGGRLVWGQDDWEVVEKPANPPAEGAGLPPGVVPLQQRDLEQQIFSGKTPSEVKEMLMARGAVVVDCVERACKLTEAQRKELELAAQGDVSRFFRDVKKLWVEFREVKNDPQKINQVVRAVQPLRMKVSSSFFDENSLLRKVLNTTLDAEQARHYEAQQQQRRIFQYEAEIALALAALERGVPLREAQRQKFITVLLEQTEPPKKFGGEHYYLVLYQASTLNEETLKSIFDDAQWRAIKQALEEARRMEERWRQSGLIP